MFIKGVNKRNKVGGKVFRYYQLTEGYRVGDKTKQRAVLYLGYHELLDDDLNRKIVAKLLEEKISGREALAADFSGISEELQELVDAYYLSYLQKYRSEEEKEADRQAEEARYDSVDLETTRLFDLREIGAEAMSLEMLKRIGLREFLQRKGWDNQAIDHAMIAIVSRAVFAGSEYKTEDWLRQNSGLVELFDKKAVPPSRYHLYKIATMLYDIKDELEEFFYARLTGMFDIDDKILIYDLTNTYFEGRKDGSQIAKYGRSKEKRYDCKQVVLAAVVNQYGFLKHSRIYEGNMADPETLIDMVGDLDKHKGDTSPMVVMDAGIATEKNLELLRAKGYYYVCVARSKPRKDAELSSGKPIEIEDSRKGKIKLQFMETAASPDNWVKVESRGKKLKEDSMFESARQKFEQEIANANKAIGKKGGIKRLEKVWERIGRIKERNRRAGKYYEIEVQSEKGIATGITWKRKEVERKDKNGVYYLRTNFAFDNEKAVWDIYNTVREVESTFRCLKTDLKLRPVFHQTDENVEAHLHLGLLAYNIVAPIRYQLKQHGIHSDWQNIVRTMNTQKSGSVSVIARDKSEIIIRTCSQPSRDVLEIYKALGMSSIPFRKRKFVVTHQKKVPPDL